MQYIGVFLSSRDEVPASYREAAEQVGQWIGETRRTLVYGGSGVGLMEVLARAAKQSGARVFGIVPQFVVDRHIVSETLDVEIRTAALSDRKTVMIDRSDVLVALPGGVGRSMKSSRCWRPARPTKHTSASSSMMWTAVGNRSSLCSISWWIRDCMEPISAKRSVWPPTLPNSRSSAADGVQRPSESRPSSYI